MTEGNPSAQLIDSIYEAAVATERWPAVLDAIGSAAGAWGGVFISASRTGAQWIASPRLQEHMVAYEEAGWAADPAHTLPLFLDPHPGFRAETAYRTVEEIEAEPVKAEFFIPRGLIAGAASVFQGAEQDASYLAVEGFQAHELAEQAVPLLDTLRPHLGRALSLSAKIMKRCDDALVGGLQAAGVAAAIVSSESRLRAANERFTSRFGHLMFERHKRIMFDDRFLQASLALALKQGADGAAEVRSVGVQLGDGGRPSVVHIIPLCRTARDIADCDGVLMIEASADNEALPNANLLRLLFDLTPGEARVARMIAEGLTIDQIARVGAISAMTVRTQLRSVFLKTGVSRQVDLVRLLAGIRMP